MPLARARGGASQEGLVSLLGAERMDCYSVSFLYLGAALRAGTGPRGWVAEDAGTISGWSEGRCPFPSMPEEEDLLHQLHQLAIAINHVILHLVRCNLCEEFPGTLKFELFDFAQVEAR